MPDQPAQPTQEEAVAAFLKSMPTLPALDMTKASFSNYAVRNIGGQNVLIAVLEVPYGIVPFIDAPTSGAVSDVLPPAQEVLVPEVIN